MTQKTTIMGIERNAIGRWQSDISYGATDAKGDEFEVLLTINGKPRRMALCRHEKDARILTKALQEYIKYGGDWV